MTTPSPRNSKLVSLLGLSAGAVALPQMADAQIVYSGVLDEKVGFSPGFNSLYTLDLPGDADLGLMRGTPPPYSQPGGYVALKRYAGYAQIKNFGGTGTNNSFAKRNNAGGTWDAIGGVSAQTGRIGWRSTVTTGTAPHSGPKGPGSFSDLYFAFKFEDSTAGGAERYGWVKLSMVEGPGSGPDVTLTGFAYDASGAKIAMGAIPEPSASAAIAAFGALALGGVRRWRAAKKQARA